MKNFDKEAVYENELGPLIDQIIAICTREQMPLLVSVMIGNREEPPIMDRTYSTTCLPGPENKQDGRLGMAWAIMVVQEPPPELLVPIVEHLNHAMHAAEQPNPDPQ